MYAYPQFIASNYISASLSVCISEVVNRRRTDYTISGRKKDQRKNNDPQNTGSSNTNHTKTGGELDYFGKVCSSCYTVTPIVLPQLPGDKSCMRKCTREI